MPAISMFCGTIIYFNVLWNYHLYVLFFDNKKRHRPHIHAHYGEHSAVIAIGDGEVLQGDLPKRKIKLVQAWIEIHQDDLMADWRLAIEGQQLFKIDPLK